VSQPFHDLQRLIANQRPVPRRVVTVTGDLVRVSTAQGVWEVSGSGLMLGERVTIRNGKATKIQGQNSLPSISFEEARRARPL